LLGWLLGGCQLRFIQPGRLADAGNALGAGRRVLASRAVSYHLHVTPGGIDPVVVIVEFDKRDGV
jgi:hypothetical protein